MFTVQSSMLVARSPKMGRRSGMARTVDRSACQTPTHLSYATLAGQRGRLERLPFQGWSYPFLMLEQDTSFRQGNKTRRNQAGRPADLGSAASVRGHRSPWPCSAEPLVETMDPRV